MNLEKSTCCQSSPSLCVFVHLSSLTLPLADVGSNLTISFFLRNIVSGVQCNHREEREEASSSKQATRRRDRKRICLLTTVLTHDPTFWINFPHILEKGDTDRTPSSGKHFLDSWLLCIGCQHQLMWEFLIRIAIAIAHLWSSRIEKQYLSKCSKICPSKLWQSEKHACWCSLFLILDPHRDLAIPKVHYRVSIVRQPLMMVLTGWAARISVC